MSRLDRRFLDAFGFRTWKSAYEATARRLDAPWKSIKGLRDEFDPVHPNPRRGWVGRLMLPNRVRTVDQLQGVDDEALIELVRRALKRDEEAVGEVLDALSSTTSTSAGVAERLLTGRRAEEFVLANAQPLFGVSRDSVTDMRERFVGYDFGITLKGEIAIEVKGLRSISGVILFTDREWSEARCRRDRYWLAVVGNVASKPVAEVIRDPASSPRVTASCVWDRSIRASWKSPFRMSSSRKESWSEGKAEGRFAK
jgi:hypothetical protein